MFDQLQEQGHFHGHNRPLMKLLGWGMKDEGCFQQTTH
jgi:hypothetical protein